VLHSQGFQLVNLNNHVNVERSLDDEEIDDDIEDDLMKCVVEVKINGKVRGWKNL
jgi:hypothetical protein